MRILSAWFESGAEFLKNYNEQMHGGSFYYPTAAELQLLQPVLLEVRFPELPNRMLVRGQVSVIDLKHQGAWISFLPEDRETQEFVVAVARGCRPQTVALRPTHLRGGYRSGQGT